jgi:hypothetical protein
LTQLDHHSWSMTTAWMWRGIQTLLQNACEELTNSHMFLVHETWCLPYPLDNSIILEERDHTLNSKFFWDNNLGSKNLKS